MCFPGGNGAHRISSASPEAARIQGSASRYGHGIRVSIRPPPAPSRPREGSRVELIGNKHSTPLACCVCCLEKKAPRREVRSKYLQAGCGWGAIHADHARSTGSAFVKLWCDGTVWKPPGVGLSYFRCEHVHPTGVSLLRVLRGQVSC